MSVSNTSVVIVGTNYTDFPSARTIKTGVGLTSSDGGAQGDFTISAGGFLTSLANNSTSGFTVFDTNGNLYLSRLINGSSGIQVTNSDGTGGNTVISQIPNSVIQRINVANPAGSVVGDFSQIQFVGGSNVDITVADSGLGVKAVVTISQTAGSDGTVTSVGVDSTTGLIVTGSPITTSGTIDVNLPGTGTADAIVEGDLLVGVTGAYEGLAIGPATYVLASDGTKPTWTPVTEGTVTSVAVDSTTGILVTGSPITSDGTIDINLPGTGVDSIPNEGDLLVGSPDNTYQALAVGAVDYILTSNGTTPVWSAPTEGGTVTSVGLETGTGLVITGSPVTTAGTFVVNLPGSTGDVYEIVNPGDIMIGNTSNAYAALNMAASGSNGSVLTIVDVDNGVVEWSSGPVSLASGIHSSLSDGTPVDITCPQVTSGSKVLLSLANSNWTTGNLTPNVELVSKTDGVSFSIRAHNVGGANMASTVDVMWSVFA